MIDKNASKELENNNPCNTCRAIGMKICLGHGGGVSSAGGSTSSSEKTPSNSDKRESLGSTRLLETSTPGLIAENVAWLQQNLLSDKHNTYEAGLLTVDSNRLSGDLVFTQKPNTKDEAAVSSYLSVIEEEFAKFKNQLAWEGIYVGNFNVERNGNTLAIRIPVPKYYDSFLQQLEKSNLLPIPKPGSLEESDKMQKQQDIDLDNIQGMKYKA